MRYGYWCEMDWIRGQASPTVRGIARSSLAARADFFAIFTTDFTPFLADFFVVLQLFFCTIFAARKRLFRAFFTLKKTSKSPPSSTSWYFDKSTTQHLVKKARFLTAKRLEKM